MPKDTKISQPKQHPRAELSWREGEMPFSERFRDFYYSKEDGRAETREVFLGGNGLPERWQGYAQFSIAELGFGTGLNFLETWRIWKKCRTKNAQLIFTSFEAYPMSSDEMARALGAWPELEPLVTLLISSWPSEIEESTRIPLDAQTTLEVVSGDALSGVGSWQGQADAWYLDGFAPAQNEDMWSAGLMDAVGNHTVPGGTFSTYTSAGWVRRNLEHAGFEVERVPGFGRKRHRLQGVRR